MGVKSRVPAGLGDYFADRPETRTRQLYSRLRTGQELSIPGTCTFRFAYSVLSRCQGMNQDQDHVQTRECQHGGEIQSSGRVGGLFCGSA